MNNWPNFGYRIGAVAFSLATYLAASGVAMPSSSAALLVSGGGVITPSVLPARTSGVAPLYVNFDATGTTSTASTNPSHELFFAHDFGDTGAGTWANGVQSSGLTSKNAGYGPVTGHVFETPGTYIVTSVITDGGNSETVTNTITVLDPNVVYAGTLTICISHSGNFTGAPSGATQVNTAGNTDMYAALNGIADKNNKRILFCKADAWACSAQNTFANITGMTISGYGTGAARAAVFNASASDTLVDVTPAAIGGSVFNFNAGNSDIRIHNFKINGNTNAKASGLNNSISGILFSKIELRNALGGFTAYPGGGGTNTVFDQHCLYECHTGEYTTTPAAGGFSVFVGLTRGGIMGCYFDQCSRGEGPFRIPFIDRSHINNNYIARPNKTKNIVKIHSFVYRQNPVRSEKFVFSANVIDMRDGFSWDGTTVTEVGTPSITIGNGGALGDERVRNCIVENNYTYSCLGNPKTELSFIAIGCGNITVRNNIADFALGDRVSSYPSPYPYTMLSFASVSATTNDRTEGVNIYNNTLYSNLVNAEQAYFVRAQGIGTPKTVTYATGTPGIFAYAGDIQFGAGFRVKLGGTPPSPFVAGTNYWVTSTSLSATTFTLAATDGGAPITFTEDGTCTVTQFEQVKDITVKNNLFFLPHHNPGNPTRTPFAAVGAPVAVPENVVVANNTGNVGAYNTLPFVTNPPTVLPDWRPSGYPVGAGASVPVLRDFNNASRYGAGNHLGAVLP